MTYYKYGTYCQLNITLQNKSRVNPFLSFWHGKAELTNQSMSIPAV